MYTLVKSIEGKIRDQRTKMQGIGMSTLCQNNFSNNRWLKESKIILE